ncbi:MAG: flagellar motor protein MotB [Actinomycetota bacterium]
MAEVEEDEGPSQEWLASYADAMTLLLAFFIMMFAFALIDEEKFDDFKVGMSAALGIPDPATQNTDSILNDGSGITPEIGFTPIGASVEDQEREAAIEALEAAGMITPESAEALRDLLESEFDRVGASEVVDVGIDERGVFIRFDGRVLFASGSAELDADGLALLDVAADVLAVVDNRLEIEGHTDNRPTGSLWPSNWELSSARASTVVRWLIQAGSLPAPQLMAVGLAETRPRDTNDTPEGRQANRRVEIVVRIPGMVDSDIDVIQPLDGALDPDLESQTSDDGETVDGETTDDAGDTPTEDATTEGQEADGSADGSTEDAGPEDTPADDSADGAADEETAADTGQETSDDTEEELSTDG